MRVIYSLGELAGPEERSLFLLGPTPRDYSKLNSWRPDALDILLQENFDGVVYVPEDEGCCSLRKGFDSTEQALWERAALRMTKVGVFWVPRHLVDMPGFTTNVEFGGFVPLEGPCKPFVLGYPEETPKMHYMSLLAQEEAKAPIRHTLRETLQAGIRMLDRV